MKTDLQKLWNSQIKVVVQFEAWETDKYRRFALEEIWKTLKLDWFRQWFVPSSIVEKHVQESYIASEARGWAIQKTLESVVRENKLHLLSRPELNILEEEPLKYEAIFDVMPELDLWDYASVKVEKKEVEVTEAEIDEQVEILRDRLAEFKDSSEKVKKWDRIFVDFEGFWIDWTPIDNTKGENQELNVWSWTYIPWFEENTVGLGIWEEKKFKIKFPDDYHVKEMAWNEYVFKIKVNSIQEKVLPEVDETFVMALIWDKKPVSELRDEIKKHLDQKKKSDERSRQENELIAKWTEMIQFDAPKSELDKELEFRIDNIKMHALERWLPWQTYLERTNNTEEKIKESIKEEVLASVKARFIVQEIVIKDWIVVSESEISDVIKSYEEAARLAKKSFPSAKYKKGAKWYNTIFNSLLVRKVFDKYLA